MCEKYNGWSNRETWLVKLWIDNEEESQADAIGRARGALSAAEQYRAYPTQIAVDAARGILADYFQERVTEGLLAGHREAGRDARNLLSYGSMYSDLLGTALARVDWYEIAKAYLDGAMDG
jgi:hypothetical protein